MTVNKSTFDVSQNTHCEDTENEKYDHQNAINIYMLLVEKLNSEIDFLRSSMQTKDSIIADLIANLSNAKSHVRENLIVPDKENEALKNHEATESKDAFNSIPFDYSTSTPTKSPRHPTTANDWDVFTIPKTKQRARSSAKRRDHQHQIPIITQNRYDVLSEAESPTREPPTKQRGNVNTRRGDYHTKHRYDFQSEENSSTRVSPTKQRKNVNRKRGDDQHLSTRFGKRHDVLSETVSPTRVPPTFWNNKVPGKGNFDKIEIRNGKFESKDEKKVTMFTDSMGSGLAGNYLTEKANNKCRVKVRAFNGTTAEHLRKFHMLPTLLDDPPDIAYVHVGTNDLRTPRGKAPKTVEDIAKGIIECAKTCRSYGVEDIFVSSICDRRGKYLSNRLREVNKIVEEECKYCGFTFVSNDGILFDKHLKDDGLHFNNEGKQLFSEIFLNEIRNLYG